MTTEIPRANALAMNGCEAMPLSSIAADRLGDLLGFIYDTAQDTSNWHACLQQLVLEFEANYASLIVRPASTYDLGYIVSASSDLRILPLHNPYMLDSPFSGHPLEKVIVIGDILSQADWQATSYYKNYCLANDVFHVMAVDFDIANDGVYGLRITRSRSAPPFSRTQRMLCEKLVPHLKRALNLQVMMNQDQNVSSLYRQTIEQLMVGVFILDENGTIIETNDMAEAIIKLNDGLTISNGKLGASHSADNRQLQKLLRIMLNQHNVGQLSLVEAMSVSRPSGRVAWGLVVQSIAANAWTEGKHRPCAAIFLRDSDGKSTPPLQLTQQLFQLTAAETALAIQLANGLSLDEASEELSIRRNTARAHLRSIFSKTGVRRQTELVRIFLNSVALLGNRKN